MNELDVIILTHDIEKYGLRKGDRGVIVHVYKNGIAYEVEFLGPDGNTIALVTLKKFDIRKTD